MKQLKAVLFDLDGTLVDSVPGIHQAVNRVLQQYQGAACSEDEVRHWIGNGPQRLVERALHSRQVDLDAGVGLTAFREHYGVTLFNASFYPGVPEGLARLKQSGLKLACLTNKSSLFTGRFLEHMALAPVFDAVVCGDQVERPKPDSQSLAQVCDRFGIEPQQAEMVGDSINDLIPARDLGMPAIAVGYGYHQNQPLHEYGPRLVTERFSEVVEHCLARL